MADRELHSIIQEAANGVVRGVDALLTSVESYAPSAAGDSTAATVSSLRYLKPSTTLIVSPAAGGGAYTHNIALSVTNHAPGDEVVVVYTQPNSTNPTVVFKNATAAGTTLLTISGAVNKTAGARFQFNGTAWKLVTAAQSSATLTLA